MSDSSSERVPTVREISNDVYNGFAHSMRSYVVERPICEICKKNVSVRITRWGAIKAACADCLCEELARFEEYCKEQEAAAKELEGY